MPTEPEFKDVLGHPIEISEEAIGNPNLRIVRVKNSFNLEDLSKLHTHPSASYSVQQNTVVGIVDTALRVNGLVPSWVTDTPIRSDEQLKSGTIYLDRICGTESFFQLLHPRYYLDAFTPAIYLMSKDGSVVPAVGTDLSKLNLADYQRMVIGVQFIPIEMPTASVISRWKDRYHGLSDGHVQLTAIQEGDGRPLIGVYSLIGGMTIIGSDDLTSEEHNLRNVYKNSGEIIDCDVAGDTLIAVADRALERKGIYRKQDTYIDGHLDKRSNVYLVTAPGLEKSLLEAFKIVDPRDVGVLVETSNGTEPKSKLPERTEPGKGRLAGNETTATPGMQYDIVAMIQGVYDRRDQLRKT